MSRPSAGSIALPCAALVCWASFAAATPCLPSASAVRQDYPGAWPSWTLRAEGHEGVKCWYPATRPTATDHQREAPSQIQAAAPEKVSATVETAPTHPSPIRGAETRGVGVGPENAAANHQREAPSKIQAAEPEKVLVTVETGPTHPSPIRAAETHGFGPENAAANNASISALEQSSFLDRFAAAYAHNSFGDSSLRRYLVQLAMSMSEARDSPRTSGADGRK
jgi:hypothetical protein